MVKIIDNKYDSRKKIWNHRPYVNYLQIIILFFFLFFLMITVLNVNTVNAIRYRRDFQEIALQFYQTGDLNRAVEELEIMEKQVSEKANYDYYVFQGEKELLIGEMKELLLKEEARKHFENAVDFAEKALEEQETILATRILYEGLSRLFNYRGTFFVLRNFRKADRLLNELIENRAEDEMILLLEAIFYVEAPGIAGGDTQKGIQILNEITESGNPAFNFVAYKKLYDIYLEEENDEKIVSVLEKLKREFPESPLVVDLLEK